jgi:hypothetical protein
LLSTNNYNDYITNFCTYFSPFLGQLTPRSTETEGILPRWTGLLANQIALGLGATHRI